MSILVKGMEMPTSCFYCPMLEGDRDDGLCHAASRWLDDEEYWQWYQYPEGDIDTSKPSNCPLVPVPPHGRLIDADAFTKDECNNCDGACGALPCDCLNCEADCRCDFMKDIADAPTIIPASDKDINVLGKEEGEA